LIATAKRQAARTGLYSRFFRGPVLCSESLESEQAVEVPVASTSAVKLDAVVVPPEDNHENNGEIDVGKKERKKRKRENLDGPVVQMEGEAQPTVVIGNNEATRQVRKAEKEKKSKTNAKDNPEAPPDVDAADPQPKKRKKASNESGVSSKPTKRKKGVEAVTPPSDSSGNENPPALAPVDEKLAKALRKEERRKRRAEKAERRAARQLRRAES